MKKSERISLFYDKFYRLGFCYDEIETLRRAQMTLHRWAEHECNGAIQRDEATDIPYWHSDYSGIKLVKAPDREKGALKRVMATLAARNARNEGSLSFYHQTDPRGCSLYIMRPGDVPDGEEVSSYYSRGIAVCI